MLLGGAASRVNARLQAGRRVGLKYDVSAGEADESHCQITVIVSVPRPQVNRGRGEGGG